MIRRGSNEKINEKIDLITEERNQRGSLTSVKLVREIRY